MLCAYLAEAIRVRMVTAHGRLRRGPEVSPALAEHLLHKYCLGPDLLTINQRFKPLKFAFIASQPDTKQICLFFERASSFAAVEAHRRKTGNTGNTAVKGSSYSFRLRLFFSLPSVTLLRCSFSATRGSMEPKTKTPCATTRSRTKSGKRLHHPLLVSRAKQPPFLLETSPPSSRPSSRLWQKGSRCAPSAALLRVLSSKLHKLRAHRETCDFTDFGGEKKW